MQDLLLFLPCAHGVEPLLLQEVARVLPGAAPESARGGVLVRGAWRDALTLNLQSRLAQRVLVQLSRTEYRNEQDLYDAARAIAWEAWFTERQTFKVDLTAQASPLQSLNFATLKVKDAVVDRFRDRVGVRPSIETQWPDARVHVHLTNDRVALYIDTTGEPLFKRGWREDKGDAPLKETLAAAMIAASGWDPASGQPLYDPCCGSGTIAIEAAQLACGMAPGRHRRFGFEKLAPYQAHVWQAIKEQARSLEHPPTAPIFGSDVAHRMVDFAMRNAERANVAKAVQLRGGDALQRMPPSETPGVMLVNPPYGERIEVAGVAGSRGGARARIALPEVSGRELAQTDDGSDFFSRLASHWKANYAGWTAWVLTPDAKLPSRMRLKESRKVPMWNGPIECRLMRFDMVKGSARDDATRRRP